MIICRHCATPHSWRRNQEAGKLTVVRMLADDLTGSLDTICPFASTSEPIPVFWQGGAQPPVSGSFAFDTETRELSTRGAVDAIADLTPTLLVADVAIKKLDSLLRGHTAAEIAACLDTGAFASTVLAPAFPAQGRITRNGRQIVLQDAGRDQQELTCDLHAELSALGHIVRHAKRSDDVAGSGIFLCDAETDADLDAVVAAGRRLSPPVLWCGSAGLTCALSVRGLNVFGHMPSSPVLIIVGSDHRSSAAQTDTLAKLRPELITFVDPASQDDIGTLIEFVAHRIDRGLPSALAFRFAEHTSHSTAGQAISETLAIAVEQLPRPSSVLVTGGDTLFRFVGAAGAESLKVSGELMPGVPVSMLEGGHWDALTVISKSGAFGNANLLCNLLNRFEENSHAVT
jgi:uncharacterized protein YgbK (DUF1537 family)